MIKFLIKAQNCSKNFGQNSNTLMDEFEINRRKTLNIYSKFERKNL